MHCSYEDPTTHESLDVDCGRMMLCGFGTGACTCDASSCTSRAVRTFSIDFHVTGNDGTGTIDGHNAYLTR
jgi:hypothetical protein